MEKWTLRQFGGGSKTCADSAQVKGPKTRVIITLLLLLNEGEKVGKPCANLAQGMNGTKVIVTLLLLFLGQINEDDNITLCLLKI